MILKFIIYPIKPLRTKLVLEVKNTELEMTH